jgi:hypothetical protein
MKQILKGFISYVCLCRNKEELLEILEFSNSVVLHDQNYEVIICTMLNQIDAETLQLACNQISNVSIFEISAIDDDSLISAGLEIALGDWVFELPNPESLTEDVRRLLLTYSERLESNAESCQLKPSQTLIRDRVLSTIASRALDSRVFTLTYTPRLTKRSTLNVWDSRKLKSKVIRVAPQLDRTLVCCKYRTEGGLRHRKKLIRIGLRTIAHSSAKPLRWISFTSLLGAFFSILASLGVLIISLERRVVPGWTTTNLQISSLSFLILLVLGGLGEYIYQITAASINQVTHRIINEHLSNEFSFQNELNVTFDNPKHHG